MKEAANQGGLICIPWANVKPSLIVAIRNLAIASITDVCLARRSFWLGKRRNYGILSAVDLIFSMDGGRHAQP